MKGEAIMYRAEVFTDRGAIILRRFFTQAGYDQEKVTTLIEDYIIAEGLDVAFPVHIQVDLLGTEDII